MPRDVRNVLRRFQSAFDLKAAHSGFDQFLGQRKRQILWTQQILLIAKITQISVTQELIQADGRPRHIGHDWPFVRRRFAGEALT